MHTYIYVITFVDMYIYCSLKNPYSDRIIMSLCFVDLLLCISLRSH